MSSSLKALLARIPDEALRAELAAAITEASATTAFGLVFEKHLPETVRLPHHPIRRGVKVALRDVAGDRSVFEVARLSDGKATLLRRNNTDGTAVDRDTEPEILTESLDNLAVVAEFGDPIYPGLKRLGSINRGGDKPAHVVINAENHHALEMLRFTHAGKVDCIYIDPPYNLGGDLTYNDHRVARDDAFRHSKWLSFMHRRLVLAKQLLTELGIIIVAIDDTEQAHLRLLMDQVFGEQNHVATVIWQGGRKNDARFVSVGHDYMLIFSRSQQALKDSGVEWDEHRPAHAEMLAAGRRAWLESGEDPKLATQLMKKWIKSLPPGHPAKTNNRFYEFDEGTGRVFRKKDVSWPGGGGPRYDVIHPVTGKPVRVPSRGWIYSDPFRMQEEISAGRILFGADHDEYINRKLYLDEADAMVPTSVFEQKRTSAGNALKGIFGEERFKFPKDTAVLARWLKLVTSANPNAVILDYFGGSGSTVQAVIELNAEDDGRRQCVLITNNEVDPRRSKNLAEEGHRPGDREWEEWGLFEYVARPRVETVTTGKRADGSVYSDGVGENVEFLELTYQDVGQVELDLAFNAIAPMLWLRAGAQGPVIEERRDTSSRRKAYEWTDRYGVLFDTDRWSGFVADMPDSATAAFVVTDSMTTFAHVAGELPGHLDTVRLYERYLTTFAINTGEG